jgi:hypothetical protein
MTTDKLLGAFLAARRLPPAQQDALAHQIASEVATLEGERHTELRLWPFADRRVYTGEQRPPANHAERRVG